MWTIFFLKFNKYKAEEIENFSKKQSEKRDLKYLKKKDFFFYKYWYPFYLKRKQKDITIVPDYLEIIFPLNKTKSNSIGEAVSAYFSFFKKYVTDNSRSLIQKSKHSNLMLYYTYNAGLYKSLYSNLFYKYKDYETMLILDFRYKKPRAFLIRHDKCVFSLSSGILLKKLDIKEKSAKKSQRIINIMVKTILKKIVNDIEITELAIYIKGVKPNINKLVSIFNEFSDNLHMLIMWNFCIRRNNIRFKKIKAIKRNLLKKLSKK